MQTAVATGKRASFRQKREGMEQIINGFANEIEYDSRTETLKLTGDGLIKRLECEVAIDEITGGVIVYNAQTEQFTVDGKAPGDSSGRVRIIIQPRPDGEVAGRRRALPPPAGAAAPGRRRSSARPGRRCRCKPAGRARNRHAAAAAAGSLAAAPAWKEIVQAG